MGASNPGWKRQERQIARALGCEREPNDGRRHGDCLPDIFCVEIKTRAALPGWLHDAVAQVKAATRDGRVPIVVLNEVSRGVKPRRYVVVAWDDWLELHGPTAQDVN